MNAILMIILFAVTALSLYFVANERKKLSGTCDVISLCLIIVIAYQFELMNTILLVLLSVVAIVLAIFIGMRKKNRIVNNNVIEYGGE